MDLLKTIWLIIILSSTSVCVGQNEFTVIQVIGKVTTESGELKTGSKITEKSKIKFSSNTDLVCAINASKGRIVLQPKRDAKSEQNELNYIVKDIYLPTKAHATTKSVSFSTDAGIQSYFKHPYLVLPTNYWSFNVEKYPLTDESFFFIRYRWSGDQTPVNKKLMNKEGQVYIELSELIKVEEKTVELMDIQNFQLFYVSGNEARKITDLELNLIDPEVLNKEVEIIKTHTEEDKAKGEVKSFLQDAYGNFNSRGFDEYYSSQE